MLNVKYVATQLPLNPARFKLVHDTELPVWENPRAFGPAWIVGTAEISHGDQDSLARLATAGLDLRQTALVERDIGPLDQSASTGTATLTHFGPHVLELQTVSPGTGLLVLSEIAFPGWRASVDGVSTPVLTANYILRAARIPAGSHKVAFRYEPASYKVGLYLTCLAVAAGAAFLTCGRSRKPATI